MKVLGITTDPLRDQILGDRIAVLEVQVSEQVKRSDKFDADIDNFKVLLSDIRSDVSFIRGKMEVGSGVGFGK